MKKLLNQSLLVIAYLSTSLFSISAYASSEGVVISQVFGGNHGSTLASDYVELFNASSQPVNIAGWSVQYASGTGTGTFSNNGVTTLNGTLAPGQYYLVEMSGSSNGAALPTADASGNSNLSASRGKVVLVNNSNGLACNGGSAPCTTAQTANIVDLVGYGTANYFETAAAPSASTSTAIFRADNGCTDTDDNSADFSESNVLPRNTSSARNTCDNTPTTEVVASCSNVSVNTGASGNAQLTATDSDSIVNAASITSTPVAGISLSNFTAATGDGETASVRLNVADTLAAGQYPVVVQFSNNDAQTGMCTATVNVVDPAAFTQIYKIQGAGTASPYENQSVTTQGVVTAVFPGLRGFYVQDQLGDNDSATSDGVFVFVGSTPTVNEGDEIRFEATVEEYFTITELTNPSNIQTLSTENTIAPLEIEFPEATEGDLEAYEGMLVKIITPMTAEQNYFQGRYGQVTLGSGGRLIKPTNIYRPNSQEAIDLADENARRRITLDDGTSAQNTNPIPYIGQDNTLRAGDTVDEITGVIHHGLITSTPTSSGGPSDYLIHPTKPVVFKRTHARTASPEAVGGNVKVASFNVLNYFTTFRDGHNAAGQSGQGCSQSGGVSAGNCRGANNQEEFTRQRDKIINAIIALDADVIGLMEIQNNGVTAPMDLVNGLNAVAGAATYAFVDDTSIDMGDDAIKNALIYRPAHVTLVGSAMSDTHPINDRPTVAQTFTAENGEKFSVLVNHFKSKSTRTAPSGLDVDQGDGQGAYNFKRTQEAEQLAVFAETIKSTANDDDILIIGDLNAYGKEDPIDALVNAGFSDQIARFNGSEGYSFTFDGEVGYLDHALANESMAEQVTKVVHWHINTDEPSVIDYNTEFKSQDLYTTSVYRSSDHDPVIIGLNLQSSTALKGTTHRDRLVGTAAAEVITGGLGRDNLTGGAGADVFVYNSLRDSGDTINDFTPGEDRIQLTNLFETVGYNGTNPFAEGYAKLVSRGANVYVMVDVDGPSGRGRFRPVIRLMNSNASNIDVERDFIW